MISLNLPSPRPRLRKRVYAAARQSHLEWDWLATLLSADQEIKGALVKLRARSRQLARDNAHMASFLHLLKTQVIGPHGIRLQSRIVADSTREPRKNINESVESAWKRWGRKGVCTADGRLSWRQVENLYLDNWVTDGEVLIRHRPNRANPFGYDIYFIDPDQLDESFEREAGRDGNAVSMGVEQNELGRPVAYHILTKRPGQRGFISREAHRVRVPASEIIHDFVMLRPGQSRGVPWATPVMLALNMFDGYTEAELVASRSGAAKSVYYEQDPTYRLEDADEDSPSGTLVEELQAGVATLLPPGVKAQLMDPQHPNGAFEAFQKAILRTIASGLNVSYHSLTGDLRDVNYSSIRQGSLLERDGYRTIQQHIIESLCDPVFDRWLPMAYLSGQVMLPSADVERWTRPTWQPRGWAWVDPLKDIMAGEAAIALGVSNRQALCAAQGTDFEDNIAQLKREKELAAQSGIDVTGLKQSSAAAESTPDTNDNGRSNGNGHRRFKWSELAALLDNEE